MLTRCWSTDEGAREIRQLAGHAPRHHAPCMFVVTEAEAAAIRATFEQQGELSAAIELRRLFPGITDNVQARECARHSVLAAFAATPAQAVAPEASPGALTKRSGTQRLGAGDLTFGRWGCRQRISTNRESITAVTTIDAAR